MSAWFLAVWLCAQVPGAAEPHCVSAGPLLGPFGMEECLDLARAIESAPRTRGRVGAGCTVKE